MSTLTNDELFGEMLGRINHLDVRDDIECRAYEIAMASLAAEPVAWLHSDNGLGIPAITRSKNIADSWLSKGWYVQPLYIAKPVPVVPDARPSLNNGIVGFDEGWNACRAAMLHGAEPVSQTYKSQHTQFEQVADLYEMQFDDGRTCAFHTDAQKAAQWLQACDGNRVQEYVKLERLRNALSGNSPVTPDGWISCSERTPNDAQWCVVNTKYGYYVQCWSEGQGWLGDDISIPECDVINWMPLPEPPQEVNRG
ncbi:MULTISPECIES: DUF551 domain-containing protein [unclassified Escherichia]|uniref:DUF551 domain-containing protein n=1 Tax=unclassified Escherichia TaxID=2608889 RepID=UPI000CF74C3B|nr:MULTISPECIES: DUF551 domain-containing protein [unclassified Escherichia]